LANRKKRNEIFSSDTAKDVIPKKDVMKEDFDWEVPVEIVPIPSEGKVYPQDSSLHGRKTLEIKAMTAKEEDILASRALIQQGKVVPHLIHSCLIDKSIDVDSMILGDRNALMVSIRITGYGSDYQASVVCPECGQKSENSFELSQLAINRLKIDPVAPGTNEFSFTLPITKKVVNFKFMTGHDDLEISTTASRRKKMMPGMQIDNVITSRLSKQIVSVNGTSDQNKINMFVNNMPAQDSRKLRAYIGENEPGIDMKSWMKCPHCGTESEVALPLGAGFFWPTG
jgi:rRNA maturation protein Nop10